MLIAFAFTANCLAEESPAYQSRVSHVLLYFKTYLYNNMYPHMLIYKQIHWFMFAAYEPPVEEIRHAPQKPNVQPSVDDFVDFLHIHPLGISACLHNVPFPTQPGPSTL